MTQSAENPEAAPAAPLQPAGPEPVQYVAPVPEPSAEELAAAAEKKAKRRRVFAKSAALAVPALALVGLLIGTGIEANAFTTKDNAASTAAKAANVADGLVGQLRAAQSAADASILVDPGCVAAESKTTASLEDKFLTDSDRLLNAEKGTSYSAFMVAANAYVNDLQSLSTNLQQDAALSKRQVFKSAMGTVTGDLGVVISAMQTILAGNVASSTLDSLDAAANRMDGDSTAVDTLCGGDTLTGGSGSSSSGGSGSGTTSA